MAEVKEISYDIIQPRAIIFQVVEDLELEAEATSKPFNKAQLIEIGSISPTIIVKGDSGATN